MVRAKFSLAVTYVYTVLVYTFVCVCSLFSFQIIINQRTTEARTEASGREHFYGPPSDNIIIIDNLNHNNLKVLNAYYVEYTLNKNNRIEIKEHKFVLVHEPQGIKVRKSQNSFDRNKLFY